MTDAGAPPGSAAVPGWLVWVLLGLLVLPFDPHWFDFEQVRRGLLLVLAGACLVAVRGLPPVRGERWLWLFVGCLLASAVVQGLADAWFRDARTLATFQPWDAVHRIAHWLALLVVLRVGAASRQRAALPLATLLAVTAAFGLLQRLGLGELAGYGVEREPVSVFGNLNVAAEWTAIAGTAVAALWPAFPPGRSRTLAATALALAGAYVVVDQSRSGLVALPVGLVLLGLLRRREGGFAPLLLAAAGGAAGLVIAVAVPRPDATDAAAERRELQRGTSTVQVRLEIAKGVARLISQSPVLGLGPGQFAVHYPRVRSQQEIEISSHERRFPTEVRTAHDDWLELLVDGGALALLAFAWAMLVLQRHQPDKARLLPLFVLLLLMLVRAPLWNAPAAVAALWLVGAPAPLPVPPPRWWRGAAVLLGLLLLALGVPILVANQLAAGYLGAVGKGEQPSASAIESAARWMPFEPRWLELLTREKLAGGDLRAAATTGAQALQLRPHHPQLYLNLAEVLARGNRFAEARDVARQGLAVDPANPELRVLVSTVLAQLDDADGAIAAVVVAPHPLLRSQLANHFRQIATLCQSRGLEAVAARLSIEHHAVAAIDGLGDQGEAALAATNEHIAQLMAAMVRADRKDGRAIVASALHQLDLGKTREAMGLGETVRQFPPLLPWQRSLFGDQLERLRSLASWQPFFAGP